MSAWMSIDGPASEPGQVVSIRSRDLPDGCRTSTRTRTEEISNIQSFIGTPKDVKMDVRLGESGHMRILGYVPKIGQA